MQRRYPIGAEPAPEGVHFRVWAPERRRVQVVVEGAETAVELEREGSGYFSGLIAGARAGLRYRYRLDGAGLFPDPASRFQPDGPHEASEVIDPSTFPWSDASWPGVELEGQVIYEMHIGTFTQEGTWQAAKRQLPELADAGITVLEIMPVADFPGRFGWGYDGVDSGSPQPRFTDARTIFARSSNEAHRLGLGVILDVVYNHVGPDGNYLKEFSEDYFTTRYANEWGEALNFDGENAGARARIGCSPTPPIGSEEFHLDGLRLDATQQIFDASPRNIMTELAERMRAAAGKRKVFVVAENEPQQSRLARSGCARRRRPRWPVERRFPSSARGRAHRPPRGLLHRLRRQAAGADFRGQVRLPLSGPALHVAIEAPRCARLGLAPWHSSPSSRITIKSPIGRAASGWQQLTSPGRIASDHGACCCSRRERPCCFRGRSSASSKPFLFFADHKTELAKTRARRPHPVSLAVPQPRAAGDAPLPFADPGDPATFERCKLDFSRARNARAHLPAPQRSSALAPRRSRLSNSVRRWTAPCLATTPLCCDSLDAKPDDRLLLVNLGSDLRLELAPEPLLAPPAKPAVVARSGPAKTPSTAAAARSHPMGRMVGAFPATSALVMLAADGVESMGLAMPLTRVLPKRALSDPEADPHLNEEWLVTNGLGGYASGTVSGAITRRYHGLLIAALPNPLGRMMMLNGLSERFGLPDRRVVYTGAEELAGVAPESTLAASEFRLEAGLPVWRYDIDGLTSRKALCMPYRQNTVHVDVSSLGRRRHACVSACVPAIHFRGHDDARQRRRQSEVRAHGVRRPVRDLVQTRFPDAAMLIARGPSAAFTFDRKETESIPYPTERSRGYDWRGSLWSPGYFRSDLGAGDSITLIASTESWETVRALGPDEALHAELESPRRCYWPPRPLPRAQASAPSWSWPPISSSSRPVGRVEDAARARAAGDEIRTVIAGYHWFTDWGRDTMISLEGLTLATGRTRSGLDSAHLRLLHPRRTHPQYVSRKGRRKAFTTRPMRRSGSSTPSSATCDSPAIAPRSRLLLPKLVDIIDHHIRGTRFGIGMDPDDAPAQAGRRGISAHLDGCES